MDVEDIGVSKKLEKVLYRVQLDISALRTAVAKESERIQLIEQGHISPDESRSGSIFANYMRMNLALAGIKTQMWRPYNPGTDRTNWQRFTATIFGKTDTHLQNVDERAYIRQTRRDAAAVRETQRDIDKIVRELFGADTKPGDPVLLRDDTDCTRVGYVMDDIPMVAYLVNPRKEQYSSSRFPPRNIIMRLTRIAGTLNEGPAVLDGPDDIECLAMGKMNQEQGIDMGFYRGSKFETVKRYSRQRIKDLSVVCLGPVTVPEDHSIGAYR